MKPLSSILFLLMMCLAVTAFAANQEVKVDVLMSKITQLLKADKAADALPYMSELEAMEPYLSEPLPESFHYYYVDTLDKAGYKAKALSRASSYAEKYGKKGKYYGQVVEIMGRLQIEEAAEQRAREESIAREAAKREKQKKAEEERRKELCNRADRLKEEYESFTQRSWEAGWPGDSSERSNAKLREYNKAFDACWNAR